MSGTTFRPSCLTFLAIASTGVGGCVLSTYDVGLFNNRIDYAASLAEHRRAWDKQVGRSVFQPGELRALVESQGGFCENGYRPRIPIYADRPCGPSRLSEPLTICTISRGGRMPLDVKGFGWHMMLKTQRDGRLRLVEMDRWNPVESHLMTQSCFLEKPWNHHPEADWPRPTASSS